MNACIWKAAVVCAASLALAAVGVAVAAEPGQGGANNPIRSAMQPVALVDGRLSGAGGEALIRSARDAQYVLIGEEHGIAESALVAEAMAHALRPDGRRYLINEIGPFSAREIERLVREGDEAAWDDFYRSAPFSIPFFWFREEVAFARAVIANEGQEAALWGLDQEFVLSPALHLDLLLASGVDPSAVAYVTRLLESERSGLASLVETRNPMAAPLMMFGSGEDIGRLREMYAGDEEVLRRLDAIEESRAIYGLFNQGRGFENNLGRARLMKRQLREHLSATPEGLAGTRLIGKFGANHVFRGHTPARILDIGSFLAELAEWNGNRSFHLLVLPVSGARNMVLPFTGPGAAAIPIDCASLGSYAVACEAAGTIEGWQYVDLAAIRPRLLQDPSLAPKLAELAMGFDAVVYVNDATPATMFKGNLEIFPAPEG